MKYKGYQLEIDLKKSLFGATICWIKSGGLTVSSAAGRDRNAAIVAAKRQINGIVA